MPQVIELLERIGQDANLRYSTPEVLAQTLANAGVEQQTTAALLGHDSRALETLLGSQRNVCCLVYAPADEEDDAEESPTEIVGHRVALSGRLRS